MKELIKRQIEILISNKEFIHKLTKDSFDAVQLVECLVSDIDALIALGVEKTTIREVFIKYLEDD